MNGLFKIFRNDRILKEFENIKLSHCVENESKIIRNNKNDVRLHLQHLIYFTALKFTN